MGGILTRIPGRTKAKARVHNRFGEHSSGASATVAQAPCPMPLSLSRIETLLEIVGGPLGGPTVRSRRPRRPITAVKGLAHAPSAASLAKAGCSQNCPPHQAIPTHAPQFG